MRRYGSILKFTLLILPVVFFAFGEAGPAGAAQPASKVYFSRGQAAIDPQNPAKSHQQAIKNFMAQGLLQAVGAFLGPEQIGSQYEKLQKGILGGPEKYIDTYQVYSEKQIDGEYQVVGQVTVTMDTLKNDLVKLGALASQNAPAASASQPQAAKAPTTPVAANTAEKSPPNSVAQKNPDSAQTKKSQPIASPAPSKEPSGAALKGKQPLSRGIVPTKKEVLWAVVEKWDEKWVLPTDSSDIRCIFARSLAKQMDRLGFSILLVQPGAIEMDTEGNIPPYQAVSLARELGVKHVVVGKISYISDRNSQEVSLNADLRVLGPDDGQAAGHEIKKTLSMDDLSNQAGATELASMIAPQLSVLFGGPKESAAKSEPGSPEFPSHLGKLVIHLPSLQYSHWTELEKVLHGQFQTMHVDDLQIGPSETLVNLSGVDSSYILKMDGARLASGFELRIDSYSTQEGAMKISFIAPAKVQAQPK
ncbi:MAG: hypothetical protein ACP5IL_02755 [Syntrophobacteraceae bacterium]